MERRTFFGFFVFVFLLGIGALTLGLRDGRSPSSAEGLDRPEKLLGISLAVDERRPALIIAADSQGERLGFRNGDEMDTVNGVTVTSVDEVRALIVGAVKSVGSLSMTVRRTVPDGAGYRMQYVRILVGAQQVGRSEKRSPRRGDGIDLLDPLNPVSPISPLNPLGPMRQAQ